MKKNRLINAWLGLGSKVRYGLEISPKPFKMPDSYAKKFAADFSTIESFNKDFETETGNWVDVNGEWKFFPYHPGVLSHYYDPECFACVDGETLFAEPMRKPKEINGKNIPVATPRAESFETYRFGVFVFEASLPVGKQLWPALWFSGGLYWPPEIDLVECFPNDTLDFNDGKGLSTNVHVRFKLEPDSIGSKKHRLRNPCAKHEYAMWWTEDFIKFYYDGYLVRKITKRQILERVEFDALRIIVGCGASEKFTECNQPLMISKIEVWQKP